MTPKEKAKELVLKFGCKKGYAKIAVDEIIKSNPTAFYEEIIENIGYTAIRECNSNYWEEVKQEITNC
jgi:hypothetical protein